MFCVPGWTIGCVVGVGALGAGIGGGLPLGKGTMLFAGVGEIELVGSDGIEVLGMGEALLIGIELVVVVGNAVTGMEKALPLSGNAAREARY